LWQQLRCLECATGKYHQLAINAWDTEEWLEDDAGWHWSCVKIQVPFHCLAKKPGPHEYTVMDFYHKSLVSVIKEKISNKKDAPYFHYDPYELYWQCPGMPEPIQLYGELYTSSAFNSQSRPAKSTWGA
jgi:hypothetical protein